MAPRQTLPKWIPSSPARTGVFFGKLAVSDPDAKPEKASDNPIRGKERRLRLAAPKEFPPYRPPPPARTGVFFDKLSVSDPDAVPLKASDNPIRGKERRLRLAAPKEFPPYRPPSPPRTVRWSALSCPFALRARVRVGCVTRVYLSAGCLFW